MNDSVLLLMKLSERGGPQPYRTGDGQKHTHLLRSLYLSLLIPQHQKMGAGWSCHFFPFSLQKLHVLAQWERGEREQEQERASKEECLQLYTFLNRQLLPPCHPHHFLLSPWSFSNHSNLPVHLNLTRLSHFLSFSLPFYMSHNNLMLQLSYGQASNPCCFCSSSLS